MSEDMFRTLLDEGIDALKGGNKTLAYDLFQKATKVNPDSEVGWLWLAGVTRNPQEAAEYLKRVLAIDPTNQQAISGLRWAQDKLAVAQGTEGSESDAGWSCPLCQTQFPEQLTVCRSCGSVLTFNDLDALLRNKGAKHIVILDAIKRLRNGEEDDASFDTNYNLALAYLNLGQIHGGTVRLRQALRLRPDDSYLKSRLEVLERIASMEDVVEKAFTTVLVVDDSPTICRLVKIALEREGYRVITAADGQEGLAKIKDELPDLVLLDITMPRMDGYQLCEVIKTDQETANIPVIMLSGKDDVDDKEMGRKVGSSGYITKPFEPKELVKFVGEYTKGIGGLLTKSLVNLVQLICLEKQSAAIIITKENKEEGIIYFNQGEIIDAAAGPLHGEDAVLEILTWNEGKFRLSSDVLLPRRTITTSWESLLAEGRRRIDGEDILERDDDLASSEFEHDNALELDLIYLLSKLEHSRVSLTDLDGQGQPSDASGVFSKIIMNVVETAEKHLPGDVLDGVLSVASTSSSGMNLLKIKNDLMSGDLLKNDQKWQEGDNFQSAYSQIGSSIVEILDRFFDLITDRFQSVSIAERWTETCDAFLTELRLAIEGHQ